MNKSTGQVYSNATDNSNTSSLLETTEVPRRALGGITVTQLAGRVLKFSVLWRGKRTPQDRGATAFILPVYDVFGDVALYMPSTGNLV